MEMTPITPENYGFIQVKYSDEELQELKKDAYDMLNNNFNDLNSYSKNLAGNLEKEFSYNRLDVIDALISPAVAKYNEVFPSYTHSLGYFDREMPDIKLNNAWINFQTKHEFNPMHTHSGVFSFVIWLDIPYNMRHERMISSVKNSNFPSAGSFSFVYTTILGNVLDHVIYTDVNYNNCCMVFPAKLSHIVYPFYTSNAYRISVSGNYKFVV